MSMRDIIEKTNEQIKQEIYKAIGKDSGIEVQVHDGVVKLSGFVTTPESLDFIESTIRELPGVDEIENELQVKIMQ